jgi:hypothetical protein
MASEVGQVVIESSSHTFEGLVNDINVHKANIIIMMERSSKVAWDETLTKLLMLYPRLLVIIVNEDDNWIHIYRKQDVLMTSSADLVTALRTA